MLVVGLGNPGERYARTRHNVGFRWVDELHGRHGGGVWKARYRGAVSEIRVGGAKVTLLKPETFMNASGESVLAAMAGLRVKPEDMWVAHDELDLPFGTVRFKVGGGVAGHNGLKSIVAAIGAVPFRRVRFGIGHPGKGADVASYVLARFAAAEEAQLPPLLASAADGFARALSDGFAAAVQWLHGPSATAEREP